MVVPDSYWRKLDSVHDLTLSNLSLHPGRDHRMVIWCLGRIGGGGCPTPTSPKGVSTYWIGKFCGCLPGKIIICFVHAIGRTHELHLDIFVFLSVIQFLLRVWHS